MVIVGTDSDGLEIREGNIIEREQGGFKIGDGIGVVMYLPTEFMCVGSNNYKRAQDWKEWPWGNLWLFGKNGGFGLSTSGCVPKPTFKVIGDISVESEVQKDFLERVNSGKR